MYGQDKYGVVKYAGRDQSGQYAEEYFQDLSGYIPHFLRDKREIKATTTAEGYEIGLAFHNLRDVFDQAFIPTATWGLSLWERDNGVTTNLSLSFEERREILSAKLRGSGTVTGQMLKHTAEAFSGGEVEIIEKPEDYMFIIRFVGQKGIPRNMQAFMNMLEDIKPAHLAYKFEYTYTTWNSLKISKNVWLRWLWLMRGRESRRERIGTKWTKQNYLTVSKESSSSPARPCPGNLSMTRSVP